MKLRILSDLHLEWYRDAKEYQDWFKDQGEDVVIAAGDIHHAVRAPMELRALFPDKEIVYVAGNHEFYGYDYDVALELLREEAEDAEVHFLENDTVTIQGQRFLGTTLWAGPMLPYKVENFIADFNVITKGKRLFKPDDCANLNWKARKFLELRREEDVVVTHFMPDGKYTHPRWAHNAMNGYFANDIDPVGVKLWVFGHTHDAIQKDNVVCNPRGYKTEYNDFNPNLIVEI